MANLLQKASIVLTPTAYDNGKVLCAKPSEPPYGDFDFSRNSAATRVNAQGLVENVQILSSNLVQNGDFSELGSEEVSNGSFSQEGSELVVNGNFDTDSDWNKLNATIIGGKGNLDGVGQTSLLWQTILTENKFYKATFTISNYNEIGDAKLINNSGFAYYTINSNGTFTTYFKHTNANGNLLFRATNGAIFSIDNVSVKEVGQDWTFGTGWSVGEDKAVSDGSQTGNSLLQQASILTLNKTYKVSYELIVTSGSIYARLGFSGAGVVRTTSGTFVEYIECDGNTNFDFLANSSFEGSVTNISVKEVGQNWVLGTGATISNNLLNFDNVNNDETRQLNVFPTPSLGTYEVSFDISNYVGGHIDLFLGGYQRFDFNANSNGTWKQTCVISNPSSNDIFYFVGDNFTGSITNISVIEITDDTNLPRINYEGFSYQDALGSELILNGSFDNGSTDWSLETGWSISGGVAIASGSTVYSLKQVIGGGILPNTTYQITYNIVTSTTDGAILISLGTSSGGVSSGNSPSVGKKTIQITTGASTNNSLYIKSTVGTARWNGSIDNVSVKEYLGQEVVPDSGCGSWLFEPQTTQLLSYSEDFSQWNAGGDTTIESGYLAPDGTNNAYKVSGTSSALLIDASLLTTTTRSIYARTVSGSGTISLLSKNDNTNNTFTLTEQWQRFEVNSANTTGASSFYAVDFRNPSATLSEVILWGANATNDQDYATSYIPSNGSTVTRNRDLCTNGGSLASINSTEGVLYAEIAALSNDLTNRQISLNNGTTDDRIQLYFNTSSNRVSVFYKSQSGATQFILNHTLSDIKQFNKLAFKWKQNDFALWSNGLEVATQTSGVTSIANTLTNLDFQQFNSAADFFGKTKALAVWKEALSDAELTELTTI